MDRSLLIVDSVISLAALGAILVLIGAMGREPSGVPLKRRLRFGLVVLAVLLASRVADWWTGWGLLGLITVVAAGLVPLATLLLTEGLLRRHAPFSVKVFVAGGALLFAFAGLLPDQFAEPWRFALLFGFQLAGFAIIAFLAVRRDRTSLSPAENQAVDRIALSLILILPLLATDYRGLFPDIPVRLGGLAILFLCWLMISLGQRTVSHRDTLFAFVILFAAALAGGWAIATAFALNETQTIQTAAIVLSAALFGVIWKDSVTLRTEQRRENLLVHLAHGDISTTAGFLDGLQTHPLVEGSLLLKDRDLADLDPALLTSLFDRLPVAGLADFNRNSSMSHGEAEQLAWLLEKYEATHLMRVCRVPLQLVALNMPSVSVTPGAEAELRVVQRMAQMISERGSVPAP